MVLYYDCFAGISGDMNLAAMIDLGVDADVLISELKKLKLSGYQIKVSKSMRNGISGTLVDVLLESSPKPAFQLNIPLSATKGASQHKHKQVHRSYKDIRKLIEDSSLNDNIKKISLGIFHRVAVAEAKVHNCEVDNVHFHEVGAVDSIVDIVGAAICVDILKPSKILASAAIQLGSGMVKCEHGVFPVPAPATIEILKGLPVKTGGMPFESTTPTGAAILAELVEEFTDLTNFSISKIAYGLGHKEDAKPNVLRVIAAETEAKDFPTEQAMMLECNIDDMSSEVFDFVFEKLYAAGAQEVFVTPVNMKKNRPAFVLSVLSPVSLENTLINIVLENTTTLGVRTYPVTKHILQREILTFSTSLGKVRVKKSFWNNIVKFKPEYEDCKLIAIQKKLPLLEVIRIIQTELKE
ncbi:MAG TPA: nickel pincer cofactor biosynthesis protein LarC [Bacteroidales bacterium]|nr:nickel pincer cofactor biosynthesis protein LarC [Bacteroidales bacterium]